MTTPDEQVAQIREAARVRDAALERAYKDRCERSNASDWRSDPLRDESECAWQKYNDAVASLPISLQVLIEAESVMKK